MTNGNTVTDYKIIDRCVCDLGVSVSPSPIYEVITVMYP